MAMDNNYERTIPHGCTLEEYRIGWLSDKLKKRRNALCALGYAFCALGLLEIALGPLMVLDAVGSAGLLAVYHKTKQRWALIALAVFAAILMQIMLLPTVLLAWTERQIIEEYKAMMAVQKAREQNP